jgi:LacI family transcriptional regulator
MPPPATIAEIARAAQVGTATVDRVLNKRPGVNAETERRVLEAVTRLGATQLRGRPRRSENFRFAYVLPGEALPFFELVDRQIAQAAGDFRHQHITEVTHRIEASDPAHFAAELERLVGYQGIALLAPDLPPIKLAVNALARGGVHVVTLFSDIAGSMRETHIGADSRAAGRTAALLLARMAHPGRDVLVLASQATRLSAEIERRIGFAQVVEEQFPALTLVRAQELPDDDTGARQALLAALREQGVAHRIAGIYNVGAATAGVAAAAAELAAPGAAPIGVAAHSLTDINRTLLTAGQLSYVLHQDVHYCVLNAARVLRALCENLRGALSVVQPRVEILTAENLS